MPSSTHSATSSSATTDEHSLPLGTLVLLGCLTAVAPLVTDLYLPGLPELATDLGTNAAGAQATLSVCLVGLALGQLVAGPLSDRVGRVAPLRWGVGLLAVTSFLCALAPTTELLLVLRLVQGLVGSTALVISRAVVRDVYDGVRAAKVYSELVLVMGLAPVLGPVIGGQLLRVTSWRGTFVFLGVISTVLLVAVLRRLEETRPAGLRVSTVHPARELGQLLTDRRFLGWLAMSALLGTILFSYITMSPFALQHGFGLSPAAYSLVFGLNAIGLVVGSQVNSRLVVRVGPARMLGRALGLVLVASALAAAAVLVDAPLPAVLVPLWFVLVGLGGTMGNATALALVPHRERAGSAAALVGTAQFLFGAAVPPIISAVSATGSAMGLTMLVAAALALSTYGALRPGHEH